METVNFKRQESRDKTDSIGSQDLRRTSGTGTNACTETGIKSDKQTFASTIQTIFSTLPKKDKNKEKQVVSVPRTSHVAPHHEHFQGNRNLNGKTGTGTAFPGMNCGQDGDDDTSSSSISESPSAPMGRQHSYIHPSLMDKSTKGQIKGKIGIGHGAPSTMSLDDTSSDDSTYSSQVK